MSRNNILNDGLVYASYKVIKEFENVNLKPPSGLYFNKALSFLNSELRREGIDIAVPHCWYRWGDEVVRYYMPGELQWTHKEDAYTIVEWNGNMPANPEDHIKMRIDSIVKELMEDYGKPGRIQDFVDIIYEGAPFEFQRKYKGVRDLFYSLQNSRAMDQREKQKLLLQSLKDAMEFLPSDKIFKDVVEFAPKYLRLMEYCLNYRQIDLVKLNEISEEFWFWFCYYLRTHPKAHENIDSDTITYWKGELDYQKSNFTGYFRDHALGFSRLIPEIAIDNEIGFYVREAIREDNEFEAVFSEFVSAVKGLDEFLAENKKRYKFGEAN